MNIVKIHTTIIICLLSIFLIGCLPKPHIKQVIPEVNGVVTFNQIPLREAELYFYKIKNKEKCSDSKFTAKTNIDGKFYFKGNKDINFFTVFGDPIESWGFCIKHDQKYYNGWTAQGIGYSPLLVSVKCELNNQNVLVDKIVNDGVGICEVIKLD